MEFVRHCNEKFSDALAADIKAFVIKNKFSNLSEYSSILDSKVFFSSDFYLVLIFRVKYYKRLRELRAKLISGIQTD
jgi:hypothetical protein